MIRVLLMCLFIASSTHDIHFTKSTIDYNKETRTLQIIMNVFTDDIELAIERNHEGLDLEIGSKNQHELTDSLVSEYTLKHIQYKNGNNNVKFNFIGFEYDYDICYLYLESDTLPRCISDETTIGIDLFFDVYDDQENVTDINTPALNESHIFTNNDRMITRATECNHLGDDER
ncbi:MAG: hypothetical protein COA49_05360 [Bacteroidetes bacterium]|nr:MAG: hypothetical protein COA49_05360 [Bacteroidota bacterium]